MPYIVDAHLASFRRFLLPFLIVNLNAEIIERFAETRSFPRRGQRISDFDVFLACGDRSPPRPHPAHL
jgi:predicted nucleic acid-binding protein